MRIYDNGSEKAMNNVILYLTPAEAQEMLDSLELLLKNKSHHHSHVADEGFKREVTLCIYRDDNLSSFDARSKKLILDNER